MFILGSGSHPQKRNSTILPRNTGGKSLMTMKRRDGHGVLACLATSALAMFSVLLIAPVAIAQDRLADVHERLFDEARFPSATVCASCHPDHYREWSASPHAYAQMSPVFNAMHGTILERTNGTNGDPAQPSLA